MSTNNIPFHDKMEKKLPKISLNTYFLKLLEEFPRDTKASSN